MSRLTASAGLLVAVVLVQLAPGAHAQRAPADAAPITLRGVVVDAADGTPVPRMRLDVIMGGKRTAGTLTADDGTFSVSVTAPDRISIAPFASLSLRTFKAGYASMTATYGPAQVRAPDGVRLAVPRAGTITGRLTTSSSVLPSIIVARRAGDGTTRTETGFSAPPGQLLLTAIPDEDGYFRIGGLAPGRYTVESPIVIREAGGVRSAAVVGPMRMTSAVVDVSSGAEVAVELAHEAVLDGTLPAIAPAPRVGGQTMRGRVTSADGLPLGNATVVAQMNGRTWDAATDALGQFAIDGLLPGSYTVSASRPGYSRGEHGQRGVSLPGRPVIVETGRDVDNVSIALLRQGVVTGMVLDEHNEPLPDVSIRLSRVRPSGAGPVVVESGSGGQTTDDRGMFRLANVRPGDYLLSATFPSEIMTGAGGRTAYVAAFYPDTTDAAAALPLRLQAGDIVSGVILTIRRVPVTRVSGVAQDSRGRPLSGTVRLTHRRIDTLTAPPMVVEPDSRGAFTFAEVPPGDYVVRASTTSGPNGPEAGERALTIVDSDPEPVAIRTAPSSTVSGHFVLDAPTGDRIWGYSIRTVSSTTAAGSGGGMTNLGSPTGNGEPFTINALSGPTRLVIATDDKDWYLRSISINGVDATDVPFDFGVEGRQYTDAEVVFSRFGASVTGQATNDRAMPVSDYAVYVFPTDRDKWFAGSRWVKLVRSSNDGSFRVPALPPGEYWLAAVDRVDAAADSRDWIDVDLFDTLAARATRTTLAEGQSQTMTLRLVRR